MKYEKLFEKFNSIDTNLILDLGTGTSLLYKFLKKTEIMFVGIDISINMLKIAKKDNNYNSLHIVCADADYLPFRQDIFSALFMITVLQNVPNPINSINETVRVSQKGAFMFYTILKKNLKLEQFEKMFSNHLEKIFTWNMQETEDFATIRRKT